MSDRDNFTGGLIAGAVFGSLVGGAIGFLLGSGGSQEISSDENAPLPESKLNKIIRRKLKSEEEKIETARRTLEEKIAQLNEAIDEVRFQLGDEQDNPRELDNVDAIAHDG
jgi:uncharacterized protein YcfJ